LEKLKNIILMFGKVLEVGKSFASFKLKMEGKEYDITLPRKDSKTHPGHKGFVVEVDENLSKGEASRRRDFTINSMFKDPFTGLIGDMWGGIRDLQDKILRHTSEAFSEDPLRVLRGMQFAARFEMTMKSETMEICQKMLLEFYYLSKERIWGEFEKLLLKSVKPSMGLEILFNTSWILRFPELCCLWDLKQEPSYHPEGDVYTHICHCLDYAVIVCKRDNLNDDERIVLMLSVLCHDFGKIHTTKVEDGIITSKGHAEEGEALTKSFLERIGCPPKYHKKIISLVVSHMFHVSLSSVSKSSVRRFALRLGEANVIEWLRVVECDHSGRPPLPQGIPEKATEVFVKSKDLQLEKKGPEPLIKGRVLIDLGLPEGQRIGEICRACFQAQLDDVFETFEEGLVWLKANFGKELSNGQ